MLANHRRLARLKGSFARPWAAGSSGRDAWLGCLGVEVLGAVCGKAVTKIRCGIWIAGTGRPRVVRANKDSVNDEQSLRELIVTTDLS